MGRAIEIPTEMEINDSHFKTTFEDLDDEIPSTLVNQPWASQTSYQPSPLGKKKKKKKKTIWYVSREFR